MLGKLLKYELKSTSRIMGVLYLALLVVAAVVGFVARGTIWEATQGNAIAVVISGLIYTLLVMALLIITIVMVLQRFYKNLLKEEGYLMHTLPVPTWMLVASKTICSLIWILLSIAVLLASVFVIFLTSMIGHGFALVDWNALHLGDVFGLFRQNAGSVFMTILTGIVQIIRTILLVYTAMAIGAAAKRHKVLYSVVTFIVILIIIGIISAVTNMDMLSSSFAVNDANACISVEAGDRLAIVGYMKLLLGQCISDAIYSVVFFFVTTWFLKNKLNLE